MASFDYLFISPPKINPDREWPSSYQNNKQRLIVACGLHYSALRDFHEPQSLWCPVPPSSTYRAVEQPGGVHRQVLPGLGALYVHLSHAFRAELELN